MAAQVGEELSRRDFLIRAAAAGAVAATSFVGIGDLLKSAASPRMPVAEGVVFPDPSLCIGCLTCEVICSRVHREQGLSDIPRIRIYNDETVELHPEIIKHYPDRGTFLQQPCLMCPEAPCLPVCPVDAVKVEPNTHARVIDEDICIACGKCEAACPFDTYDEQRATSGDILGQHSRITYDPEKDVYVKCDLCWWREGGPACVERCPVNIRILQGIVKSDHLCLESPRSDSEMFETLSEFQSI
ncbi:MAG: 4Fe-4S dicluster domain-containing protein [Anaerolineae bacterium]